MDMLIKHFNTFNQYTYKNAFVKIPALAGAAKTQLQQMKHSESQTEYWSLLLFSIPPWILCFWKAYNHLSCFHKSMPAYKNIWSDSIFQLGTLRPKEDYFLPYAIVTYWRTTKFLTCNSHFILFFLLFPWTTKQSTNTYCLPCCMR